MRGCASGACLRGRKEPDCGGFCTRGGFGMGLP